VSDAERALDTLNYSSIKNRACRIMWSQRDPSLRKSGAGNIFVKNLDRNIDNKALYDTFSLFGNILSCKVSNDPQGKSRGYGFVHYETEEAAKQAIERVNGMLIGEKTVEVHAFQKRHDRDTPEVFTNLYIKNLPIDTDEDKLQAMFKSYGAITSCAVQEDKLGRKFAFVNFETHESAVKAVESLNQKDLRTDAQKAETKPDEDPEHYLLYVGRAQTKTERAREFKEKAAGNTKVGSVSAGVNLYVKNLGDDATEEVLKELFEPFGAIASVACMKDEAGKCKGFGFVCFQSPDEATKAVTEMHLKVIKGKPLYVGLAEKREQRQERLRSRYTVGGMKGDKGKGKGGPMMGGPGMMGPMGQPMGGPMGQPMMGMMGGKGMMMGGGPMGQMMGPRPMMGKGGPMGQPMMGMMGGKPGMVPPQMMGMMGGKGPMPMMGGPMQGMMRPMAPMPGMPGMQMPGQPRPGMPGQPQQGGPLTAAALAAAPPGVQKQMLGEKLFPAVAKQQPELAGKITGMMLEMDNSELLILLESEQQLKIKVDEAMRVLQSQRN